MSLTIQKVTSYFKDLEKFEELNNEAFPDEERMSIQEMLNLVQSKKIEVSALYDKQQFIGFYVLMIENHIGYILFLAISPEQRSKGYAVSVPEAAFFFLSGTCFITGTTLTGLPLPSTRLISVVPEDGSVISRSSVSVRVWLFTASTRPPMLIPA